MTLYTYQENRVLIPSGAEVSEAFRPAPAGAFRDVIQEVLDSIGPWERGQDPIETFDLPYHIGSRAVVLTDSESPMWAVNPHHKARNPGQSPYIRLPNGDDRHRTRLATLELTGTVEKPLLTRVYPGDYMPPLPWMKTAKNAPGGRDECLSFWMRHAFVYRQKDDLDFSGQPPTWYDRSKR